MNHLQDRFTVLKRRIFEDNFLDADRTILPNFLFNYSQEEEFFVRKGVKEILSMAKNRGKSIVEINLFDLFLKVFEEDLDDVFELANSDGVEELLEAIAPVLSDGEDLIETFKVMIGEHQIVLLTGVGTAYPMLHSSGLLKRLGASGYNKPIIVFYPGTFNRTQLKLFNRFEAIEDEYQINPIA